MKIANFVRIGAGPILLYDKLIVGAPKEMGPAKGTARSHLPVALEKLVSPQSTHTQTNINMRLNH